MRPHRIPQTSIKSFLWQTDQAHQSASILNYLCLRSCIDQLPRETKQAMHKVLTMLARNPQASIHDVMDLVLEKLLNVQTIHTQWTMEQLAKRKEITDRYLTTAHLARLYGGMATGRPNFGDPDKPLAMTFDEERGFFRNYWEWVQTSTMCQMLAFLTPFAAWYFS